MDSVWIQYGFNMQVMVHFTLYITKWIRQLRVLSCSTCLWYRKFLIVERTDTFGGAMIHTHQSNYGHHYKYTHTDVRD